MLFLPFLSHHFTTAASSVCFLITNYNQKRSLTERECTFYSFLGIAPPLNFCLVLWRKPLLHSLVCRQPWRADDTSFSSLFFQILFASVFNIQKITIAFKIGMNLNIKSILSKFVENWNPDSIISYPMIISYHWYRDQCILT